MIAEPVKTGAEMVWREIQAVHCPDGDSKVDLHLTNRFFHNLTHNLTYT